MDNEEYRQHRVMWTNVTFWLLFVVASVSIVWALIRVQGIDGKMWREKSDARAESYRTVPARRGNIYSTDGKILATTVPVCDLYMDFGRTLRWDKKAQDSVWVGLISDSLYNVGLNMICHILHEANPSTSEGDFRVKIERERNAAKPRRCALILRGMPYSYWAQVCCVPGWNAMVVKTVDTNSVIREVRAHTYGNLGENVIGFRNSWSSRTYTGLEGMYDSILRGQDGKYFCRRLTRGTWLPVNSGHRLRTYDENDSMMFDSSIVIRPVIDGSDIVSTIDTRFQDIAESSLRKSLMKWGASSGCAILMEIETGYVLACASLTRDSMGRYQEQRDMNVACCNVYEPGSTFKSVILTTMLDDSTIHLDTAERVHIGGKKQFSANSHVIADDFGNNRDTGNVMDVIAHSSNVGMCELGWKYYRDRRDTLRHMVERHFPYNDLMIDVKSSKAKGHTNSVTYDADFLNFCYGYSCSVTPLQVLTFYNALGGGGRMVKPQFCREVRYGKQRIERKPIVIKEHMCTPKTAAVMKDLLVNVVENGTGRGIKSDTYSIAGKTGTASVYRNGHYIPHLFNASFAGFFPAEAPKYSCLVVAFDVNVHGSQAAAPVFKQIADCVVAVDKNLDRNAIHVPTSENAKDYYPSLSKGRQSEIRKACYILELPYLSGDTNSRWTFYREGVDSLGTISRYERYTPKPGQVPNCMGMTIKDAMALLHSQGYRVKFSGCGKVTAQTPRGNTTYQAGNTVVLTLN